MWMPRVVLLVLPVASIREIDKIWGGTDGIKRLLRGSSGSLGHLTGTSTHDLGIFKGTADLQHLRTAVASALSSPYSIVTFSTPAWEIPLDMSEDPPYLHAFQQLNASFAQYAATRNSIYLSSNSGKFMHGVETLETDGSAEHAALGFESGSRVPASEVEDNLAAKHLVIQASYPGGPAYFGHAIDNVFPRVLSILPGAKLAGHRVSVVVPQVSREFFSHNTQVLFERMGVQVLEEIPQTPHRMAGVTNVASWDRLMRQNTRNIIREELFRGLTPAACADGTAGGDWSNVFLSRRSGTRNGRAVEGEEVLEEKLQESGFHILDDPGKWPVDELARKLYTSTCRLVGFAGTALLNLVFLPNGAKLVEYNPTGLYADYWEWAHALNMSYVHAVPSLSISADEADRLVQLATA
ncbi:unnamed protein product [Symbiodinium pilosum]|uniref:Glycosyltransferase 61 catalytic domain-containing protein n=1 Tax=Symbiodinium pilosum TaxID=2952 RepID=A0A812TBD4_SYMPI|nr:unnamed protein product [Symbiodinium pilosum]